VQEFRGKHTFELNLSGNVVLPGFIDSHVHLIDGGLQVVLPICLPLKFQSQCYTCVKLVFSLYCFLNFAAVGEGATPRG
jgi:hypothetical protein